MPLLIAIVAALGVAAFCYYRLRAVGTLASEPVEWADWIRGAYRRSRSGKPVETSPLAAVQDPATAAATMLVALASVDSFVSPAAEDAIRAEMGRIIDPADAEEIVPVACWLAGQASDPDEVSLRYSKLWIAALTLEERLQFYAMASRVSTFDREPDAAQRQSLTRLKDRLGLFRVGP